MESRKERKLIKKEKREIRCELNGVKLKHKLEMYSGRPGF